MATKSAPEEEPEEVEEEVPAEEEVPEPAPDSPPQPSPLAISPDNPVSITNDMAPGEGFESESVTMQTMTMNIGFDVNGEAGNSGDKIAYVEGHWFIIRKPVE